MRQLLILLLFFGFVVCGGGEDNDGGGDLESLANQDFVPAPGTPPEDLSGTYSITYTHYETTGSSKIAALPKDLRIDFDFTVTQQEGSDVLMEEIGEEHLFGSRIAEARGDTILYEFDQDIYSDVEPGCDLDEIRNVVARLA